MADDGVGDQTPEPEVESTTTLLTRYSPVITQEERYNFDEAYSYARKAYRNYNDCIFMLIMLFCCIQRMNGEKIPVTFMTKVWIQIDQFLGMILV
ncbi:hypothetical protein AAKU52_002861 [Pedobacter sp. CG_S7]|uniref:hypothetical protein n=1 Tax=Pedobacter sp. CG_S7 TaxID=3143930 RepID=UPI0033940B19